MRITSAPTPLLPAAIAVVLFTSCAVPVHRVHDAPPCPDPRCACPSPTISVQCPEKDDDSQQTPTVRTSVTGASTFPGLPINVGPGTSGQLEWNESGNLLPANPENELRSDLANGTFYLTAKFNDGGTWQHVERIRFEVQFDDGGITRQLLVDLENDEGCLTWTAGGGVSVGTCDYEDEENCPGVPAAFLGTLVGDIEAWKPGSSTPDDAKAFKFKPVVTEECE